MSLVRLTVPRIQEFACCPGRRQSFLKDTASPHLAVRATIGGAKSLYLSLQARRSNDSNDPRDVRDWDLEDARVEARRLQVLVDRHIDPREVVREDRERKATEAIAKPKIVEDEERRKRYTLRALGEAYALPFPNTSRRRLGL